MTVASFRGRVCDAGEEVGGEVGVGRGRRHFGADLTGAKRLARCRERGGGERGVQSCAGEEEGEEKCTREVGEVRGFKEDGQHGGHRASGCALQEGSWVASAGAQKRL